MIKRLLMITKQIFNYNNTKFAVKITSKVENGALKMYTLLVKIVPKRIKKTVSG